MKNRVITAAIFLTTMTILMLCEGAFAGYVEVLRVRGHQMLRVVGNIDRNTVNDFARFRDLRGFHASQPTVLILDNPGGEVFQGMLLGIHVSSLANEVYKSSGQPLKVAVLGECDSMCINVFVDIAARARKEMKKQIQIFVLDTAVFGFHSASGNGIANPGLTAGLIGDFRRSGVSRAWLHQRRSMFETTKITRLTGMQLVVEKSGLVLPSELYSVK